MPEILVLTAAVTPATSSAFTISGPASIQAPGLAASDYLTLEYQYEGGSWYPAAGIGKQGRITGADMPRLLVAPGTYRIQKGVTTNAVEIAYVA
jgi:hypothetical protein